MSTSTNLKIISAAYSAHNYGETWYGDWEEKNHEIYAGREGIKYGGTYFCSQLEFSTLGMNFTNAISITLTLTVSDAAANCGRTSAFISSQKLTGKQVYNIDDLSELQEEYIPGFVGHTFCTSHPSLDDSADPEEKVSYQFNNIDIKPNQTYYIYLKRRVGLLNSKDTVGTGGWSEFKNPCYNENYQKYGEIIFEYLDEPDWPNSIDTYITPAELNKKSGKAFTQEFQVLYKSNQEPLTHSTLQWSYEVYDDNDRKVNNDAIDWIGQEGNKFSFTENSKAGYTIYIIASWGEGDAYYHLKSKISFLTNWEGLKDWISGYVAGVCGFTLPILIQTISGYNYNGSILPVLPFYDKTSYPYICINQSAILSTSYIAYISSQPFYYDNINRLTRKSDGAALMSCEIRIDKDTDWSAFKKEKDDFQMGLGNVLWTNQDIKDKEEVVRIETYAPTPVYY